MIPALLAAVVIAGAGADTAAPSGATAEIAVIADEPDARAIARAVSELLATANIQLRWTRLLALDRGRILSAPRDGATARVWIDVGGAGHAHLYFADHSGTRFAARSVAVPVLDAVAQEILAQIVGSTLNALLDPSAPALDRAQMEQAIAALAGRPAPPASPDRTDDTQLALEGRLAYDGRAGFATAPWAQGLGVEIAVLLGGKRARLWAGTSATRAFDRRIDRDDLSVGATLAPWTFRVLAGVELPAARSALVRAGIGAGFDSTEVVPHTSAPATVTVEASRRIVQGAVRAAIDAVFPLGGGGLSLFLSARVDVSPRLRLGFRDGAAEREIGTSLRFQPGFAAGVGWQL